MPDESTNNQNREAAELERKRCATISEMTGRLNCPELAGALIRDGATVDECRAAVIDHLAERERVIGNKPALGGPDIEAESRHRSVAGGAGVEFRQAACDALLLRAGLSVKSPHPAARDVDASIQGLVRVCASRAGITSGSPEQLLKRTLSTSDFPSILADSLGKALRLGYEDEPASHRQWVNAVPVKDFKSQTRPILGSIPDLEKVQEGAEYTDAHPLDESESYVVEKFGKMVQLTWEALKNDDLSAFLRIQPGLGSAARRKESDAVYDLFSLNSGNGPSMTDGDTLFHANHTNIATGASLSHTYLGEARSMLRKQTALGGGLLNLQPRFLIVPAESEQDAELLLAQATRHSTVGSGFETESARPEWISRLELVVEPRLASGTAFLASGHPQIDTCELGLLDENFNGPTIEQETAFASDVARWKVRHVLAAKFLDWRGIIKMPLS